MKRHRILDCAVLVATYAVVAAGVSVLDGRWWYGPAVIGAGWAILALVMLAIYIYDD